MSQSCRLYLVSPPIIDDPAAFAAAFARALEGGDAACLQLRLKDRAGTPAPDEAVLAAARAVLPIAREKDAALLINDRPDIAAKVGADGVHIGQKDTPLAEARKILGADATIGVTCHDSRHLALEAGEAGADYVAFGAFFPTETKEAPTRAEPALLEWWAYATTLPCVAIGGITPENCGALVRAGADFLAVSGAVWNDPQGPDAAVRRFNAAMKEAVA